MAADWSLSEVSGGAESFITTIFRSLGRGARCDSPIRTVGGEQSYGDTFCGESMGRRLVVGFDCGFPQESWLQILGPFGIPFIVLRSEDGVLKSLEGGMEA